MLVNYNKISVVTPSYNQAQFIERTILSVINQNYPNLEYIVIDGGSNDGSLEIIKKYSKNLSKLISEKDNGQSDAINKGFALSTGEIICWLNSDDILQNGSLFYINEFFNNNSNIDCVYGNTIVIDQFDKDLLKRHEIDFDFDILIYAMNYIPQSSTFWRRVVYEKIKGLDINLHYTMDHEYWLRMYKADFNIKYVNKYLSSYRWHNTSKGNINSKEIKKERKYLKEKYAEKKLFKFIPNPLLKLFFRIKRQFMKIKNGHNEFIPGHLVRWYLKFVKKHFK